jgi:hypothetical protein
MSNSYKKQPGGGMCSTTAQKKFRSQENRRKRRKIKTLLLCEEYEILPTEKDFGNEWSSPRDGKQYWIDHDDKWMRK